MKGGISTVFHRYIEASYKYFSGYNPNKEFSTITYLDANSLCDLALSQNLPTDNSSFLEDVKIQDTFRLNISKKKRTIAQC